METINDILKAHGMAKSDLARRFEIPYKTIQNWTAPEGTKEHRACPPYIIKMIIEILDK